MAASGAPAAGSGFGSTLRRDAWWVEVLPVIVLLGGFGLYATLRAFEGKFYEWGPYLSPFYSPLIDRESSLVEMVAGDFDFRGAAEFSRHLLLLQESVLPRVFRRSAGVLRGRAKAIVQRRNEIPVHPAKSSSLRALSRDYFSRVPLERRLRRVLVGRKIWHGRRHARAARQHHSADHLHAVVPFATASCGRETRLFFVRDIRQAETWCVVSFSLA